MAEEVRSNHCGSNLDGWWWTEFESSVVRTYRLASHDPRARNRSVAGPIPVNVNTLFNAGKTVDTVIWNAPVTNPVGASLAVNDAVCVVIVLKQGGNCPSCRCRACDITADPLACARFARSQ